jgi:hypothetical protein
MKGGRSRIGLHLSIYVDEAPGRNRVPDPWVELVSTHIWQEWKGRWWVPFPRYFHCVRRLSNVWLVEMEVAMAHDEDCENLEGMCAGGKKVLSVGRKTLHKRVPMFSLQDFNIVVYLLLFDEGKCTRTGLGVASLIKVWGFFDLSFLSFVQ